MNNNKLEPKSLVKFWQNAKKLAFVFSLFMVALFVVTNPSIKTSGLYHKMVNVWHSLMELNDLFMFVGLVSTVTFVLLVATKRVKPKHDDFIWDIAKRDLKCESAYYDEQFLYIKINNLVSSYSVQMYVEQINSLSENFKYELESIKRDSGIVTIRPLQISDLKRSKMHRKIKYKSAEESQL